MRLAGVAAALVVLVALPAAARQAEPGMTLWPVRAVGQQVRDRLADTRSDRAHLRLSTAEDYLAAGTGAAEERRKDMADAAEEKIEDALEALKDLSGPEVAAARPGPSGSRPRSRRWSARRTLATLRVGRRDRVGRRQLRPAAATTARHDDPRQLRAGRRDDPRVGHRAGRVGPVRVRR